MKGIYSYNTSSFVKNGYKPTGYNHYPQIPYARFIGHNLGGNGVPEVLEYVTLYSNGWDTSTTQNVTLYLIGYHFKETLESF